MAINPLRCSTRCWRRATDSQIRNLSLIVIRNKKDRRRLLVDESRTPVLKKMDRVLAAHYGFTDEELDFIPSARLRAGNYDIKYRMGRDVENNKE